MASRLKLTLEPQAEPLTLDEAKAHLRLDTTDDDDLIRALIRTARTMCEAFTGRALIHQGYSLFLDHWPQGDIGMSWSIVCDGNEITKFPMEVELPKPPLTTVTKINIFDANDVASIFSPASYYTDTASIPGRITLRDGAPIPTPGRTRNGIEIQYTAGYGVSSSSLPAPLVHGIKLLLAALYENRGDTAEDMLKSSGCLALFQPFRIMGLI